MNRFCRLCGKILSQYQTKFCCKEHWLEFERENTKTGRLSGSKKVGVVEDYYTTEDAGKHNVPFRLIYSSFELRQAYKGKTREQINKIQGEKNE